MTSLEDETGKPLASGFLICKGKRLTMTRPPRVTQLCGALGTNWRDQPVLDLAWNRMDPCLQSDGVDFAKRRSGTLSAQPTHCAI